MRATDTVSHSENSEKSLGEMLKREEEEEEITDCDLLSQTSDTSSHRHYQNQHHQQQKQKYKRNSCWTINEIGNSFSLELQ